MAQSSRVSMDETFVFLRKGSKRRPSQIADHTVDQEDVLCSIPKPSYKFLLILSIIQLIIIIAGVIAFGALGHLTCQAFVSTECEKVATTSSAKKATYGKNIFTTDINSRTSANNLEGSSTALIQEMITTMSKIQSSNDQTLITNPQASSSLSSTTVQQNRNQPENMKRSFPSNLDSFNIKGRQIE